MRSSCLSLMFFLLSASAFGQVNNLKVGASMGINFTDLRNLEFSYGGKPETYVGAGWNAAATACVDVGSRFRTIVRIGGLVEKTGRETFFGGISVKEDLVLSWSEGSFQFAFLPIARPKFELQAGTGLTIRRIIKASEYRQVGPPDGTATTTVHDVTDKMHNWNYLLPVSLTAVFDLGLSGTVLLGAEFQSGLRSLFEMYDPPLNFSPDYGAVPGSAKSYSISLKLAFVMPVRI